MPLTQFYTILGSILIIVPFATTFACLIQAIVRHLRLRQPLKTRALLLLCLIALVPALGGIALLRLASG